MPIKVLSACVMPSQINEIVTYYNQRIQITDPILKYFDDGNRRGFFVRIFTRNQGSFNDQVRQMQWKNNVLVSYYNYHCLKETEELLLYQSMQAVFGPSNVTYYPSVSDIFQHSPVTFSILMRAGKA